MMLATVTAVTSSTLTISVDHERGADTAAVVGEALAMPGLDRKYRLIVLGTRRRLLRRGRAVTTIAAVRR